MIYANNSQPIYVFRQTSAVITKWVILSLFLFIFTVVNVAGFYQAIHNQPFIFGVGRNVNEWWKLFLVIFVNFLVIPTATFIVHELIHGVAFTAYTGSPRYSVRGCLKSVFLCHAERRVASQYMLKL